MPAQWRILEPEAGCRVALKIGTLCGNGPNLWINMQTNHDLWHEACRMRREIEGIEKAVAAR